MENVVVVYGFCCQILKLKSSSRARHSSSRLFWVEYDNVDNIKELLYSLLCGTTTVVYTKRDEGERNYRNSYNIQWLQRWWWKGGGLKDFFGFVFCPLRYSNREI